MAMFQMYNNNAPSLDGFPAEFYQAFWDAIKLDVMALFDDFQRGELPLYSLSFKTIILPSKCKKGVKVQ